MTKRIEKLDDYISAGDAAKMLSERLGRPISNRYLSSMAQRKKNPVRTKPMGNRFVYNRADIEQATVTQKRDQGETSE